MCKIKFNCHVPSPDLTANIQSQETFILYCHTFLPLYWRIDHPNNKTRASNFISGKVLSWILTSPKRKICHFTRKTADLTYLKQLRTTDHLNLKSIFPAPNIFSKLLTYIKFSKPNLYYIPQSSRVNFILVSCSFRE